MDTCTNCGAMLRQGAKFCTTCGSRLNSSASDSGGWTTPSPFANTDSQETSVLNVVTPLEETPAEAPAPPPTTGTLRQPSNSWTKAYSASNTASTASDPASRFISALDPEVKPAPDIAVPPADAAADVSWTTPPPAFTPPPPSNWSYGSGEDEAASATEKPASADVDTSWTAPSTWATVEAGTEPDPETTNPEVIEAEFDEAIETSAETETDLAGFSEDGDDEVDYLSGDENIEVSGYENPVLPPNDARDRAIELVDELRRMVRMMGSGGDSEPDAAIAALTNVRLKADDFSDVRRVLADVKTDPRDIQALSRLAEKVDRVEALLDDHTAMTDAIDEAIRKISG